MTEFDYSTVPLDESNFQIRLLRFPRQHWPSETLWCELEVFSLYSAPPFAAISYAWGDKTDQVQIHCNALRSPLSTPKTLHDALNCFANDKYGDPLEQDSACTYWSQVRGLEWIWADALCINQSDNREKSSQVRLMGRIYAWAACTFVWLGGLTWESFWTVMLVQELHRSKQRFLEKSETRTWWEMGIFERWGFRCPNMVTPPHWNYASFLQKGWFTRIWIIQELAKSRDPLLMINQGMAAWDWFREAFDFVVDSQLPIYDIGGLYQVNLLGKIRDTAQKGLEQPLLNLLILTRGFECSDERDKIFALLGLATDGDSGPIDIKPDYEMGIHELHHIVALKTLLSASRFDLLSVPRVPHRIQGELVISFGQPADESSKYSLQYLPSWVPDWKSNTGYSRAFFPLTNDLGDLYSSFNAAPASHFSESDLSRDALKIRLSGYEIGSIQETGETCNFFGRNMESHVRRLWRTMTQEHRILSDWEERICDIHSKRRYEATGETMRDVYWQTLTAGQSQMLDWYQSEWWDFATLKQYYSHWDRLCRQPFRMVPFSGMLRYVRSIFIVFALVTALAKGSLASRASAAAAFRFRNMTFHSEGRRMFRSDKGHIGLAPAAANAGDQIFLVEGCRTPLILRWIEDRQEWNVIGDSYLHGFMGGEGFDRRLCKPFWLS